MNPTLLTWSWTLWGNEPYSVIYNLDPVGKRNLLY